MTYISQNLSPKGFDNSALDNKHRTFSSKVQVILSTTPFYCGV